MVYRRRRVRRYGRKRKFARGGRYNTVGAIRFLAKKAYRGVRYIKSMINTEKSYYSKAPSGTVNTTGTVTLLNDIAQGDDVGQRQGNSILAKMLYGRLTLSRDPNNTNPINSCRFIIVKDMENIGTAPAISDVLQTVDVVSSLNVDHLPRYQVLMDKVYTLSSTANQGLNLRWGRTINDHLKYTGPALTDVYKNALYLITIGDQATSPPGFTMYSRLSYYDN